MEHSHSGHRQRLRDRYEQSGADVVRGLTLEAKKGDFLALLGGNGTAATSTRLRTRCSNGSVRSRACSPRSFPH